MLLKYHPSNFQKNENKTKFLQNKHHKLSQGSTKGIQNITKVHFIKEVHWRSTWIYLHTHHTHMDGGIKLKFIKNNNNKWISGLCMPWKICGITSHGPTHAPLFFVWAVLPYHHHRFDLFIHMKNKLINQVLSIGLLAPHLKEKRTRMEKGEVEGERSTLNSGNTIYEVTWFCSCTEWINRCRTTLPVNQGIERLDCELLKNIYDKGLTLSFFVHLSLQVQ